MKGNTTVLLASAMAAALSLAVQASAGPAPMPKFEAEKCYGVAKAGKNDCANLSGSHSCAGQATSDMSPAEWNYVAKGSCKDMKGLTAEEAKAKVAKK